MNLFDESVGASPTLVGPQGQTTVAVLSAGSTLGNYQIVRLLGAGGMGAVYLAEHIHLGTRHAIKTIRAEFARQPGFEKRFMREAKLASRLKHPHIVACTDTGVADGVPYLVMDYIEGPHREPLNLRQLLDQRRERGELLDEDEAAAVGLEICKALDYAHSFRDAEIPNGIIHRDLKPANILLDKDTKLYIADFGLARTLGEKFEESVIQAHALSRSLGEDATLKGQAVASTDTVGTFDYMSPEQREGRIADARSDVYAMGVILYELLTGRKVIGVIKPPSAVRPGLDPIWDDIILSRCLAYDPDERYTTAGMMCRAIEGVRSHSTIEKQAASDIQHLGKPSYSVSTPEKAESTKHSPNATKVAGAIASVLAGVLVIVGVATRSDDAKLKSVVEEKIMKSNAPADVMLAAIRAERGKLETTLDSAQAVREIQKWDEALHHAEGSRSQATTNVEAHRPKVEAEQKKEPSLLIAVDAGGQDVTARIDIDGQCWLAPHTFTLASSKRYVFKLSYQSSAPDKRRWKPAEMDLTADWRGFRSKRVSLEELKEPQPGDSITLNLGNGMTLDLVWIPAGNFMMGSPTKEENRNYDEGPQHQVTISSGFWMGKTEVTQQQYEQIAGKNPSYFRGPELPAECVSWSQAKSFCEKLQARLPAELRSKTVRLPTEAEWEYACRAGSQGPYVGELAGVGWYSENSGSTTHPVGQKLPNAWGLHDMHGNVWEWCWNGKWEYTASAVTESLYTELSRMKRSGNRYIDGAELLRVNRGGSWYSSAQYCRSASRNVDNLDMRSDNLGFRVVVR